jgi:hypothetical protein
LSRLLLFPTHNRGAYRYRVSDDRFASANGPFLRYDFFELSKEIPMKAVALIAFCLLLGAVPGFSQQQDIPKNIAESVGDVLQFAQQGFLAAAEAMPPTNTRLCPLRVTSRRPAPSPSR